MAQVLLVAQAWAASARALDHPAVAPRRRRVATRGAERAGRPWATAHEQSQRTSRSRIYSIIKTRMDVD